MKINDFIKRKRKRKRKKKKQYETCQQSMEASTEGKGQDMS